MGKLGRGYRATDGVYDVTNKLNGMGIGLNSRSLLVIKLPDSRALRIISRSLLMAIVLLALPSIGSIIGAPSNATQYEPNVGSVISDGLEILPIIFRDLVGEGLIKKGHKGFLIGANVNDIRDDFKFLRDASIDLLTGADLRQNKAGAQKVFDFVFAPSFRGIQMIDGIIKDGGLVVVSPLGVEPSDELRLMTNFKIVYLRRFANTVIALRKTANGVENSAAKQVSCGFTPENKKAALKGLEDVYLEPPRRTSSAKKSGFTSRKIKFLPDLLKDSLDEYPRRVFISDNSKALDWFYKNYPMRDQEFEVYSMDVGFNNDGLSNGNKGQDMWMDWLTNNLHPEDYVVMKAEAQVVEEMLKNKSLCHVDELFLECKNQWQDGEEENVSKRAYWQCLALYGKVRDEGIAVHQWWY
ncbi:hypothetical protein OROGR_009684 [Orobanche gracilis]